MKLLFLGDVFGAPGREALKTLLPGLRQELGLDAVVCNGENSAHGRGITVETANDIFHAGVDVITLGDHTFDQKGTEELLLAHAHPKGRLIRPANYGQGTVGRGHTAFTTTSGKKLGVINLQGRVFMKDQTDNPFARARELMQDYRLPGHAEPTVDALIVDIHCEATSEKCMMGHVWDGKASLVVGTHTHIPTSDTRIQPGGTAYQTDAGMCGDYQSSLGVSFASALPNWERKGRFAFQPATGPATLSGVFVETSDTTGLAIRVQAIRRGGVLQQA